MELNKIKKNIKTLSIMFFVLLVAFLSCLFINNCMDLQLKIEETSQETEENSYGTIEEIPEQENIERFPQITESGNIVGNTACNLFQGNAGLEICPEGRVAIKDNIIAYSKKVNDHYNLILQDKSTGKDSVIYENCDVRFLHIYDDFIIGVKQTKSRTGITDVIFNYDLQSKKTQTFAVSYFDVTITSFMFDGNEYYFTLAYDPCLYSIDIKGTTVNVVVEPQEFTLKNDTRILNIKNNLIFFTTPTNNYSYNIITGEILSVEEPVQMIIGNDYSIFYDENNQLNIAYQGNIIFTGNINAINFYNDLYFSSGNILYFSEEGNIIQLYDAQETINEIFVDDNNVIVKRNNELVFAKKGDSI